MRLQKEREFESLFSTESHHLEMKNNGNPGEKCITQVHKCNNLVNL